MFQTGTSLADVAILAGVLVLIIFLLATMERWRKRQAAGARKQQGPVLAPLGKGLSLSPDEERILGRLGWLLRNPRNRHRLLDDRSLYLRAARRALKEGIASERDLVMLARRAGLDINQISADAMSTLKLAAGVEVSVADAAMNSGAGSVAMVHPETLRVRLRRGQTSFPTGTDLDVVCNSNQGLYRFRTRVRGTAGRTLHLEHTDRVEQVQRRAHRRHELELQVEVAAVGTSVSTRTIDLSIGGTAVKNPRQALDVATPVTVSIPYNGAAVSVPGDVVRTSRGGRVAHIRFGQLPEASRHKVFRTIMDGSANGKKRGKKGARR